MTVIHVPSGFAQAATGAKSDEDDNDGPRLKDGGLYSFQIQAQCRLEELLRAKCQGLLREAHGCRVK